MCFSPWVPLLAVNYVKCSTENLILQREQKENGTFATVWFTTLEDKVVIDIHNDDHEPSKKVYDLNVRMGLSFTVC